MRGRGGRGWALLAAVLVAALVAGCTSRQVVQPTTSTAITTPPPGTPASTTPTPSLRPAPVPVDQIPPGHPTSWVPAGVPTTALYREPGDVVPKFTPIMFTNTSDGALAMARYYIDAQNWAVAINDYKPVMIICDAKRCGLIAPYFNQLRAKGNHTTKGRITTGPPRELRAPKSSGSQWVVQASITIAPEVVVTNDTSKVVSRHAVHTTLTNLFMKWSGSIWRVDEDLVAN